MRDEMRDETRCYFDSHSKIQFLNAKKKVYFSKVISEKYR